jgi:hypothetical protein
MLMKITKRALTGAVIVAAAAPSAAAAMPLGAPPGSSYSVAVPAVQPAPITVAQSGQGFKWDDAGLGAAGMLVLVGVGSGAAVAVRRRGGRALVG